MILLKSIFLLSFLVLGISTSKLNVPRVLLPLFHDFATNFTLEVTEGGCYTWNTLRPNVVRLVCLDADSELGCCSRVVVSSGIKELRRNTETVMAEDVHSGLVLRCEVILDVIHSLNIVTTTREIFLDESPEAFEVQAYDDQGNQFSTLEGVEFDWMFRSVGASNKSGESTVVHYITFAESPYETPRSIEPFERIGLKGHVILLEGRLTGAASVTVRLPQPEYADIAAAGVQLLVLTNLVVTPPDATLLVGDNLKYRLLQFQHGRVSQIPFPSAQYHLTSEDASVDVDAESGIATGVALGRARLVLVDGNVGSASDVKPPTASLTVANPHDLALAVLPNRKWTVVVGQSYNIVTELHDVERKLFQLGSAVQIDLQVDESYFWVKHRPKNGSFVHGTPLKTGRTEVVGALLGVRLPTGQLKSLGLLTAAAELHIYDPVRVRPTSILVPWDPAAKARYEIPLSVTGGDGTFTWSSARSAVAVVTQRGVVKTLELGTTTVTAAMTANPSIRGLSVVRVLPPVALEILDTPLEAEVGVPILVYVVVYGEVDGKRVPFTLCDALPFSVSLTEDQFVRGSSNVSKVNELPSTSCGTISVVGKEPGTSQVVVEYNGLSASVVVAAYNPLAPLNPASGTTLLTVGTSRIVVFSGGPRSWTLKPSEHSHSLHNSDLTGERIEVEEQATRGPAVQKHVYAFRVSCRELSETVLTLQVENRVVASVSKPATATASVKVICGKPKYLILSPLIRNLARCPLHAEEVVTLNNKDVDIEVVVKDAQGRRFDNITSLDLAWTVSKPTVRTQYKSIVAVPFEEAGFTFPGTHAQKVVPIGRSGVVEVHARVTGYDQQVLFAQSISAESPAFPEVSQTGESQTPEIIALLTIQLVDSIEVTPNSTEILAGGEDLREVVVTRGSGHIEVSANVSGIVRVERDQRTIKLKALTVGNVLLTIKDVCVETEPALLTVQVYRIGAISLDVVEYIEKGKSVSARALLFDEEGARLTSLPDQAVLKLVPAPGSDLISIGSDVVAVDGEGTFTLRGVALGLTSLSVSAGDVVSSEVPIQVFSPLRLHPRNVTLLAGGSLQVTALDGPPGAHLEWTVDEPLTARVGIDGVVGGLRIGNCVLTARAITVRKHTGQRVVSSQDQIEVRVVPLKGVSIHAPVARLVAGGRMPLWAVGPPGTAGLLRLGSVPPVTPARFTWSLSQDSSAEIRSALHPLGLHVPDTDMAAVQLHALKPGRVTVSLSVQVPGPVAGVTHAVEFTDSLTIQIVPAIGLSNPRPMTLEHLLVSTQATTELRTTRDIRRYQVTVLRGGPDVVRVTQDGILTTGDAVGSAVVAFGPPEKPWRHLLVYVKPVEYVMLNLVPHWRLRPQDRIQVLPNGLDLELSLSFHDDEGNEFDAVRSNVQVETDQKGLVAVGRGLENGSLTLNILDSGATVIRVWDARPTHQPADFLNVRSGDVIFPANARVSVGDVICLSMPVSRAEDGVAPWTVDDPGKLRLWPELGIAVACGARGAATVSHRASPRVRSRIQVLPLHKIELLPNEIVLTTSPESVVDYPVLLSASGEPAKPSNLVASNGTCDLAVPRDFVPTCYPFTCRVNFNNPAAALDIAQLFHAAPAFSLDTGLYSCRLQCISKGSPSTATLAETVVLTAVSLDGSIQSRSALLPVAPALYLHQTELKVTHSKPRAVFIVSGVQSVFDQLKVVTDKHLVSVSLSSQTDTTRTYLVTVDSAWWTLDEPPVLTVVLWSPKTQQKLQVHLRCAGHRVLSDDAGTWLPWLAALLVVAITLLVYVWSTRQVSQKRIETTEQTFVRTPIADQTMMSHVHNTSRSSNEFSPRRPFDDYPVYGSPWRRNVNN